MWLALSYRTGWVMSPRKTTLVLVVDDRPQTLAACAKLLEPHGFFVAKAGSVSEAISELREIRPKFAIIDLHLNDGSGETIVRFLDENAYDTKMIMITGDVEGVTEYCRAKSTVLKKPIQLKALLKILKADLN